MENSGNNDINKDKSKDNSDIEKARAALKALKEKEARMANNPYLNEDSSSSHNDSSDEKKVLRRSTRVNNSSSLKSKVKNSLPTGAQKKVGPATGNDNNNLTSDEKEVSTQISPTSSTNEIKNDSHTENQDKMVSGTAWLSAANIISRLLGAIYIIPWYAWMAPHSAQANALFSMGYNVYALFLLLSTIGIPVAVAREVSRFNALEQEELAFRVVRQMLLFMSAVGLVAAAIMFIFAPALAAGSGGGPALIPVMRSLAWSVLFFPIMSVIRGYFQGLNNMKVFAISQIYEQVIRVIWMLVTAFAIMKLGSGNWQAAVTQSTTAAFIGVLASLAVLIFYLVKAGLLKNIIFPETTTATEEIHSWDIVKHTVIVSLPFVVTGSAIQIFKLVDQLTFVNLMLRFTNYSQSQLNVFFSYFSANVDKITMILIAVALTLGDVGLPLITAAYAKNNKREVSSLIAYNLQLFVSFMLPAVVGVIMLARPIYTLFYGVPDGLQTSLFIYSSLQSIILTLLSLAWLYLQSIHQSRVAIRYFIITLVIKLVIQVPSIWLFHSFGPLFGTTVAFVVGTVLSLRKIHDLVHLRSRQIWRKIFAIAILTAMMGIVVLILDLILQLIFRGNAGHIYSLVTVLIAGGAGFYVYLYLTAKIGLLEKLMGSRGTALRRKLRI